MAIDTIKTVAVLGAGTMGNGVAHVFARSGYAVILRDVEQRFLDRGLETISKNLDREVRKERITLVEKAETLERLKPTTEMAALASADFAVEAVPEQLDLKVRVLKEADAVLRPGVILATNTSSISISKLAAETGRAEQFIGMHFFNPVPVMALVEIIRAIQTTDATVALTEELARTVGKTSIGVKNAPGFVVNRILCPMINEAIFVLQEGLASMEEIDAGMKLGANHPIGPLALADLVGLDTLLAVMNVFYSDFKDPKYRPAPLLQEMVDAGYLGRKSGRGFYKY
jgi:3-hydroxybutyryl-CoA dehydrogenase